MKSAIAFSMIVLGLVGYLNLGQMIDADPWAEVNVQSTAHQFESIDNSGVDFPSDKPPMCAPTPSESEGLVRVPSYMPR